MIKDKILVIDDEAGIRSSLKGILEDEGYVVTTTDTGEKGLDLLKGENFDLVLLDIWLPQMSGLDVLEKIKRSEESSQVVMISGHGSIATAVKATKLGAYDFLEKPLTLEKVILTAKNALHQKMLEEENIQLRARIEAKYHLIGESPAIQKLKNEIKLAAPTNGRVLIYGETGTGKELVARLLHQQSPRRDKRFIQINSAAIPDYLIESELFGYAGEDKPGPEKRKKGKILLADGGSLFLDEIGDMSLKTQVKLVRFIEEETFKPLDSSESTTSDVRLIASTTKNLRELIAQGKFREDLFFKLNIIPMAIPPLRERKEDISLLIEYFLS
ncbi:MAG: sigma-54 dependent transcriptional regulator, partial [Candidatus Aminicenantes bacterium]|nr:sigma-54 dependent transcriptional regulator [Candidatus Aminicenantes bacterium]